MGAAKIEFLLPKHRFAFRNEIHSAEGDRRWQWLCEPFKVIPIVCSSHSNEYLHKELPIQLHVKGSCQVPTLFCHMVFRFTFLFFFFFFISEKDVKL